MRHHKLTPQEKAKILLAYADDLKDKAERLLEIDEVSKRHPSIYPEWRKRNIAGQVSLAYHDVLHGVDEEYLDDAATFVALDPERIRFLNQPEPEFECEVCGAEATEAYWSDSRCNTLGVGVCLCSECADKTPAMTPQELIEACR